jgi:hypothetical protein
MKNSKNNFRSLFVALVTLFSTAFTTAAHATETTGNDPITVKYVGASNNVAIFEISFASDSLSQYEIFISDNFGRIYYEKVKGKDLSRKFQFVNNIADDGSADDEILVSIKNTATKEVSTYKILPNASIGKNNDLIAKL